MVASSQLVQSVHGSHEPWLVVKPSNVPSQRVPRSTPVTQSPQSLTAKLNSPPCVKPKSRIELLKSGPQVLHAMAANESRPPVWGVSKA